VELGRTDDVGVAARYWFVEPGTVRSIDGLEQFRSVDWVHRLEMFVEVGQVVQAVKNHTSRAGCVICIGANRKQAVERAESVIKAVDIRMTESWSSDFT